MSVDQSEDYMLNLLYRMAYGAASRRLDYATTANIHGRVPRADILRELGIDPRDHRSVETVREGVEDAEARRQPRW